MLDRLSKINELVLTISRDTETDPEKVKSILKEVDFYINSNFWSLMDTEECSKACSEIKDCDDCWQTTDACMDCQN